MKRWFAKLLISEGLRSRSLLSPSWRKRINDDPVLHAFEQAARQSDSLLRNTARRSLVPVPEDLPETILNHLQQASRQEDSTSSREFSTRPVIPARLRIATAATLVVVALTLGVLRPWETSPQNGRPLSPPTQANTANTAVDVVPLPTPEVLIAQLGGDSRYALRDPMSEQIEALSEDLQAATRFLVESLP